MESVIVILPVIFYMEARKVNYLQVPSRLPFEMFVIVNKSKFKSKFFKVNV